MTIGKKLEQNQYKIDNMVTTRVPCICTVRTANMVHKGVVIGTISEEMNDAGEFSWIYKLYWDKLELFPYIKLPDIDMNLKKDEYVISYIVPTFVKQKTYPYTGQKLYKRLEELGLAWNDSFEIMCRTKGKLGKDDIDIERL